MWIQVQTLLGGCPIIVCFNGQKGSLRPVNTKVESRLKQVCISTLAPKFKGQPKLKEAARTVGFSMRRRGKQEAPDAVSQANRINTKAGCISP
jgi:hypothetical protein